MRTIDVLSSVFGSTLMTAYVVPVGTGITFAFLTARILEFQNVKLRVEIELRKIRSPAFFDLKKVPSNHEFTQLKLVEASPFRELADEFGVRGHYDAHDKVLKLHGSLQTLAYEALLSINACTRDGETYRLNGRALTAVESSQAHIKYHHLIVEKYQGWSRQVMLLRFEWLSLLRQGRIERTWFGRLIFTGPARFKKLRAYMAGEADTWTLR